MLLTLLIALSITKWTLYLCAPTIQNDDPNNEEQNETEWKAPSTIFIANMLHDLLILATTTKYLSSS